MYWIIFFAIIVYGLLQSSVLFAQSKEATERLLRLFTTPQQRQQIEKNLHFPPPPPPPPPPPQEIEPVELEPEIIPPPYIHYQGLVLRSAYIPLLLINDVLMEKNYYGRGFTIYVERLKEQAVPVYIDGFEKEFLLSPGQRLSVTEKGQVILENYQ
jgi:hypothetical protein